jgi:asparagine synthase (glutamine-hydrolysing)
MCGICGVWSETPDQAAIIDQMVACLAHRGPDARGTWHASSGGVVLGHTRLAIQDISSAGAQPMASRCGRYHIVLNGEIYNHRSLRDELGEVELWRGHSDTETLVEAIARWGLVPTLHRVNGMFALAVWDEQDSVLHLARDRIGEKPLYWGIKRGRLVFASELGPILTSGLGPFELDHQAIAELLDLSYIPEPRTAVLDVHKLRPAGLATIRLREAQFDVHETTYWRLEDVVVSALSQREPKSEREWLERVEQDLQRSVELRLISDVPLGAFLSGGVDSGLIVSMMAAVSGAPVRTFTVGVPRTENESRRASQLATHLGTEHTNLDITETDCLRLIPKLPGIYSEPFGDSSQIPTWLVSRVAREHVTVALSGDGGDELFAGYHRHYLARRLWKASQRIPAPFGKLLASEWLGRLASATRRNEGARLRIQKGFRLLGARRVEELYMRLVRQWPAGQTPLKVGAMSDDMLPDWIARLDGLDAVERLMLYDLSSALPGDMLVKIDRASMAHALETRVPFLDHQLIHTAMRVPVEMKIRHGRGKYLLRTLLAKYAPRGWMEEPEARSKVGFGVPIRRWLRGELRDWAESLLADDKLAIHGLLNTSALHRAWKGLQSGAHTNHHAFWTILMFQAWVEEYKGYLRL